MNIRISRSAFVCFSILIVSSVAIAVPTTSIMLNTGALGLGSTEINYAKNDNAVEADVDGLYMDTANNKGSVLTIREDGTAGTAVVGNQNLVTVTTRSRLSVQTGLPTGYDIHGGVITLSKNETDLAKEGLGVRAFGIDTKEGSNNYGKRYVNPDFVSVNGHGFQMEGSKEVSGGVDPVTSWEAYVKDNPDVPVNNPPHVNEDVKFDFNDALFSVKADSLTVILTKIGGGIVDNDPFNLGLDLTIELKDGTKLSQSLGNLYDGDDPIEGFSLFDGHDDILAINFDGVFGLSEGDVIDYVIVGARDDTADDPKETDEHFLINGLTFTTTNVPAPGSLLLGSLGALSVSWIRKRKMIG